MAGTTPIQTAPQPGQQTSIPASNYDINKDLGRVIDRTGQVDAPTAPNLLFGPTPMTTDGSSKVNSVYAAYIGAMRNTPNNFLSTPKYINKSTADPYLTDNYGGFNPEDKNVANWYGENQGWFKQMGNRIGKLATTTVGSFANSLMDIPNMISAVHEGNLDKVWNNPTNTWATDLQNWSENAMPNYETNWERQHPFLNLIPFYGNAGNGWGNVLQQVGFTVGAIGGSLVEDAVVGAATGGAGEVPLAALQINKAVYRLGKMINIGEDALKTVKGSIKSADDIIQGLRGIDRFNYAVRKGLWGANMITSGTAEAAFEGLDGFQQLNKDLTQEYFNQNGNMPDYDAQQKIYKTARDAGNTRFLLNVGLLAMTNSIQWGSLLKPFNAVKDAVEAEAKTGIKVALKEGSRDIFEAVQPTSKLAKIGNFVANNRVSTALKDSASEGFEEGAQYLIQTGVDDFYKRKYHDPSVNTVNNFMKSFGTGLSATLGSQEGWENIVYGVLGGAMYEQGEHLYHKIRGMEEPSHEKQIQDILHGLNTNSLSGIFENKYGETVAANAIHDDMLNAVQKNNPFLYKNYQHEQMVNFILSGIQQNKYDTRMDQIDELTKMNGDDFKQTFGIPQTVENQKTVADYVGSMKDMASYIKDVHDRVSRTFINPFEYKGTGNYKNAEQQTEQNKENEKYLAFEDAKNQLTYSMTIAKDASNRINQMRSEMAQSPVNVDEVTKLSNDKGLKELRQEYARNAQAAQFDNTLTPSAATRKNLDKWRERISLIDEALDEKDKDNANKAYNNLLTNVFNDYQDIHNSVTGEAGKVFDPTLKKEIMDKAKDIAYLNLRTQRAVDNYASLTTKGGFKRLFDSVMEERSRVSANPVTLAPEPVAPQNPQVAAQAQQTAAQNGQTPGPALPVSQQQSTPVANPNGVPATAANQGELHESMQSMTPEEQQQYAQAVVNTASGKEKYPSSELDNVQEFQTIDDLKFSNPKVDLTQYTKVKSTDGKNYYIENNTLAEMQRRAGAPVTTPASTPAQPSTAVTPTAAPAGAGAGKEGLRTTDFFSKVFVPTDLKEGFQNAIMSSLPAAMVDNMSVVISPLSASNQQAYDEQKAKKTYSQVTGYPGVFVSKSPVDISIQHAGVEIAKFASPDRLMFQVGDTLKSISNITPEQYSQLTGNPASQYAQDLDRYKDMIALKNYLALLYKNNDGKTTTVSSAELKKLLNAPVVTYGELDLVPPSGTRPTYADLQNTSLSVPMVDGSNTNVSLILSIPRSYSNDTGSFVKTDHVNYIYNQGYYDESENIDTSKLESGLAGSMSTIQSLGSRYVAVVSTPTGEKRFVALRPGELSSDGKSDLFESIKQRALQSRQANFVESTEEEADGFLLQGDEKTYYKLPNADAKKYNDQFNTNMNNQLFVSDPNGKAFYELSVSPVGAIRMEVYDRVNRESNTLYISPQTVDRVNSLDEMIARLNKEVEKRSKTNANFAALGVKFDSSNFRQNIENDNRVTADDIASQLTAATTSQVFKNGTMNLSVNRPAVDAAYKAVRGVEANNPANKVAPENPIDTLFGPQQSFKTTLGAVTSEPESVRNARNDANHYQILLNVWNEIKNNQQGASKEAVEKLGNAILSDPNITKMLPQEWLKSQNKDASNAWWLMGSALGRTDLTDALQTLINNTNTQQTAIQEMVAPPTVTLPSSKGIFGGLEQIATDDQGVPVGMVSPQEVADARHTNTVNQESHADMTFSTVKDALHSVGITYDTPSGKFIDEDSGEEIEQLAGMTPAEVAKSMGLEVQPVRKSDPNAGFDFKLGDNGVPQLNRMLNIEKARQYISANLPSFISVEDVNKILDKISVQGDVWGAFSNGVIYLNQNAAEGTQYHEAFHGVFRMMLSDEEIGNYLREGQTGLYSQLKKEGKSINDLLKEKRDQGLYQNISNQEAYNRLYEEYMADRFADWKDKKENAGVFAKLFDGIRKFFKWLLRGKKDLDFLFDQIDTGVYRYSDIAANQFTNNMNLNGEDMGNPEIALSLIPARPGEMQAGKGTITLKRNLDSKTSKQVVQNVAAYFNTYKNLQEYSELSDAKLLDTILDDLKSLYSIDNPLYAGRSEAELNRIASSDLSYIYNNEDSRNLIKEGAIKYVNTINYIEQFRDEEQEDAESEVGQPSTGYDNTAENVGGFSSLPGLLRQYIGFTSYEKIDEFGNKQVKEGVPVVATVDAVSAYYGLLRTLANITDPVKFFQRMILFSNGNEQSRHFTEKFISDTGLNVQRLMEDNTLEASKNPALLEMVRKGFNKFRIDYLFTEQDTKKSNARSYHANRKNVENTQFDKWSNEFANSYANYDEAAQKDARDKVEGVRSAFFDERKNIKWDAQKLAAAVTRTQQALQGVGIQLSPEYIKYSILSQGATKFDKANEAYKKEGVQLQFDDPNNKFITKQDYDYVQIMKTADETTMNSDVLEQLSKTLASGANPYHKDLKEVEVLDDNTNQVTKVQEEIDTAMIGRLLNIAKGNSLFDETVGESSYQNAENKTVFAHQDGTFNVKSAYQLRDANYRKQLRETGVREQESAYRDAYDSDWLTKNFLLNSKEFEAVADNLLFNRIDGMRAVETNKLGKVITQEFRDQKEGITYGHYSPREFLVNMLNLYTSYAQTQRTSQGNYVTTPHLIRILETSKTGDTVNLPVLSDLYKAGSVTQKAKDLMFQEFQKEYDRINRVNGEIGTLKENLVENYHTGSFADDGKTVNKGYRGLLFTDNMTSLIPKATLDRMAAQARNGQEINKGDQEFIKNEIANSLNNIIDKTMDILVREGLVERQKDGQYKNVFLHGDYFKGNDSLNLGPRFKENIGHVFMNNFINTLAYNQILHGDSALSLKNDGGIDAVKRAKGDNAAIVSMRTDMIAPDLGITQPFTHSNVAIFKEPVSSDGTKVADAQMYTTVNGLRYTLWGLSKLTPRLAHVLDALEAGDDIHNLKGTDGKTFDAIFDKDRGLLRWDEMTNSLKLVYKDGKSYFKMSVTVLQPNLTSYKDSNGQWKAIPGWETLHNLRTKMEDSQIHFAAPESASKMMTMDVAKASDFSDLVGHPYDNTYFGLQTANPSNKLAITTPTQLMKLIDGEQTDETPISLSGKDTTIGAVREAYQNLSSQKVTNDFNVARNDIYEAKDFEKDLAQSIAKGEVTPRLARFQQRAVDNLENTGADAQLLDFFRLDENGNPRYNLNMSATKTKFQQLYLAYFSKGVMSQKNPGYTAALFSGINTKTIRVATRIEDGKVVQWDHVRRDAYVNNINGVQKEKILSSPDEVTEVGQHYLDELRHNVAEYDENGKPTGNMYSEYMLPAHYKEFLDIGDGEQLPDTIAKGFGVRIPSQDKHSFMSLRMIDFLPTNLGSTAMFAKDIVRLSGADFDIDKEYISRYDFYTVYDNGKPEFRPYGYAKTDAGKYWEYKKWMIENNKTIKSIAAEIKGNTPETDPVEGTALNLPALKYGDRVIEAALRQVGLPASVEEYTAAAKKGELNNGVLNNQIVDTYIALQTNPAMREIANTPATLDALANIQKNEELVQRDKQGNIIGTVFGKKLGFPVDSLPGQYYGFKNNRVGKYNIGIDVQANLIYSILNKANTTIRENEKVQPFRFDGAIFNSFGGQNEFNLDTNQFDGQRTNDVFSTLITSATDEAKEQLNALYGLTVDSLKTVNYMVGLKVPLKTAIYLSNQPLIRSYLDIKAAKQNTLQTPAEERLFRDDFVDEAVKKLDDDIKDYNKLSDDDLYNRLMQNGVVEMQCD